MTAAWFDLVLHLAARNTARAEATNSRPGVADRTPADRGSGAGQDTT